MKIKNVALALTMVSAAVMPLSAAPSKPYQDWASGPASFIMTSDEQKAWKAVQTDQQASDFIDLFWARRDPTPGTPQNEALEEFERRVNYADATFGEKTRRGAMTERGRVMVVIGAPTNMDLAVKHNANQTGGDNELTQGHDMGKKDAWIWTREDAQKKFGIPKVEVVFIEDPITRRVTRDPQRGDFFAAAGAALKRQIVTPNLTTLPSWALVGGLEPKVPAALMQSSAPQTVTTTVTNYVTTTDPTPATPASFNVSAGASNLTLLNDVFSIVTETSTDPFQTLKPVSSFTASEDLGWVTRYCSPNADVPTVGFTLRLHGKTSTGQGVNRAADPDEMLPDKLKAAPGCYMLRGVVPLSGMAPGSYALEVKVQEPGNAKSYTLETPFTIR